MEEWRNIPGYGGQYQASNFGYIRQIDKFVTRGINKTQHLLTPVLKKGHVKVMIIQNAKGGFRVRVDELVLLAFVGPCPKNATIIHRDNNPHNNRLENLRYSIRG